MAKRKRLSPAFAAPDEDETMPISDYPLGVAPMRPRPPVAQVAGEAATRAALDELASEVAAARTEGRMVASLPLEAIKAGHLLRDRMGHDAEEMAALKASLIARGQQTPIEVVELGQARYGLISGARRLAALCALAAETGEARFARIQALIRPSDTVQAAYLAMVEENEIRADLSFYERGRLVAEAAAMGLYPSPAEAVKALFGHAPAAKRSKILSFVRLHQALGAVLSFPVAIPEKLGLALVGALEADPALAGRLAVALRKTPPADAAAERRAIETALRKTAPAAAPAEIVPGVALDRRKGRVVLSGAGVDAALARDLEDWLRGRSGAAKAE